MYSFVVERRDVVVGAVIGRIVSEIDNGLAFTGPVNQVFVEIGYGYITVFRKVFFVSQIQVVGFQRTQCRRALELGPWRFRFVILGQEDVDVLVVFHETGGFHLVDTRAADGFGCTKTHKLRLGYFSADVQAGQYFGVASATFSHDGINAELFIHQADETGRCLVGIHDL